MGLGGGGGRGELSINKKVTLKYIILLQTGLQWVFYFKLKKDIYVLAYKHISRDIKLKFYTFVPKHKSSATSICHSLV